MMIAFRKISATLVLALLAAFADKIRPQIKAQADKLLADK